MRIGRYEIVARLGAGGMAEVLVGKSSGGAGLERLVAVKRLHTRSVEESEAARMLVDEATMVSRLTHPGIAQVYDLGRDGDELYIAMEYVAGRDLGTLVARLSRDGRTLAPGLACHVMTALLDALGYAHAAKDESGRPMKLVHRDVSPANILISFEGDVKLIDFGVARAAGRLTRTEAGIVKGKVRYMSPEQVGGKEIDGRSDTFAAGAVLFELLTGKRLFAGRSDSDLSIIQDIVDGRVPDIRKTAPEIPEELVAALDRALQKRPDDRYPRAEEFAAAVQRYSLLHLGELRGREALQALMQELFPTEIEHERKLRQSLARPGAEILDGVAVRSAASPARKADAPSVQIAPDYAARPAGRTVPDAPIAPGGRTVPDAPVARGGHTVQDGHTVQLPGADRTALLEAAVPTADAVRDGTVLLRTGAAAHEPEAGTQLLSAQRRSRRGGVFAGIAVLAAATLAGGLYVLHSEDSTAGGAPAAVVRTGPTPPVDLPLPAPPPEIETALPAPPAPSRPIPQRVVASAATPPPAAAAGRLRVTAYPPGNVFLDGVPLKKRTPLIDHAVPVGVHTLRVVADDGRVAEEQIDVSSSQTTTIAVRYP